MIKSISSYSNVWKLGLILTLAFVYYVFASAGLLLSYNNTNVSPVWPVSGIALAATFLFGYRIWPGIFIGAFFVNFIFLKGQLNSSSQEVWVSIFISVASTLEAVLGVYLLRKIQLDIYKLEKIKYIFQFLSVVFVMCLTSSIIGSLTVCLSKMVLWSKLPTVIFISCLGGVTGTFVVFPLILAWTNYIRFKWKWDRKLFNDIVLYLLVFITSGLVFWNWISYDYIFIKSYLILPLLLWGALYFELHAITMAIVIASVVAIYGTIDGYGPFIGASRAESLLSLQLYVFIVGVCVLILRAAINERKQSELALQNAHDGLLESVKQRSDELSDFQERVNAIFKALLKYTVMDFSHKIPISEERDEIDAIATGLNTLGEELEYSTSAQLKYANELEQTNLLLIDSEQQIQSIFNNAPDSVIVMDSDSNILRWNPLAENTFGWKINEVVGKSLFDIIIPGSARTTFQKEIALFFLKEGGTLKSRNFEIEAINKENIVLPVSISISPVMMEGQYMFIAFIRDVSEQKKSEKKIKELAAIVESSDDAIISQTPYGVILSWNKAAERIYGYSALEVIGKSISITTPAPSINELQKIPDRLKQGEQIINCDIQKVRKDGELIFVSLTASAIRDNEGEIIAISLISRDITKSKKIAEEMQRITEELRRSNAELEQFAYVASHDLQEPLRMVTSYLQLLEKRYKDKLDQDATDFIGFAVDGSNRMRNLIHSLLDYSRINRIKPFEWVDVKDLLQDVLDNVKTSVKETNAKVVIGELPLIFADYVLINQLFQNIISNALKFRRPDDPEIIISGRSDDNEYVFSVQDNGIGIQKEYSEKIFVIFQRLHSKEKYSGTGMGLAICRKIVERHGGKIWVESEINKGSTFYFTIKKQI
ncbi:MAG: PAS domain S-box protein [Bacteroidota bacterium]